MSLPMFECMLVRGYYASILAGVVRRLIVTSPGPSLDSVRRCEPQVETGMPRKSGGFGA